MNLSIWGLLGLCCPCALLGAAAACCVLLVNKKKNEKKLRNAPRAPLRAAPSRWRKMGRDEQLYNGR